MINNNVTKKMTIRINTKISISIIFLSESLLLILDKNFIMVHSKI